MQSQSLTDFVVRAADLRARVTSLASQLASTTLDDSDAVATVLARHLSATADFKILCKEFTISTTHVPFAAVPAAAVPAAAVTAADAAEVTRRVDFGALLSRATLLASGLLSSHVARGISRNTMLEQTWNFLTTSIQWSGHDMEHRQGDRTARAPLDQRNDDTVEVVTLLAYMLSMPAAEMHLSAQHQLVVTFVMEERFDVDHVRHALIKLGSKLLRHFAVVTRSSSSGTGESAAERRTRRVTLNIDLHDRFYVSTSIVGTVFRPNHRDVAPAVVASDSAAGDSGVALLAHLATHELEETRATTEFLLTVMNVDTLLGSLHDRLCESAPHVCKSIAALFGVGRLVRQKLQREVAPSALWVACCSHWYCKPRERHPSKGRLCISRVAFLAFLFMISIDWFMTDSTVEYRLAHKTVINAECEMTNSFTEIHQKLLSFGDIKVSVTFARADSVAKSSGASLPSLVSAAAVIDQEASSSAPLRRRTTKAPRISA